MRVSALVLALLCLIPATGDDAGARPRRRESPEAAAKRHREAGARAFEEKDFARAMAEWKEAYAIVPDAAILLSIGKAQELAGDCPSAVETYRAALFDLPERQANEARRAMADCEAAIAAAERAAHPPVEPEEEEPEEVITEVQPDGTTVIKPPPRPQRRGWYEDWLADGCLLGGTAAIAAGSYLLLRADRTDDDAAGAPTVGEFVDRADEARRDRMLGYAGLATGAALAIVGIMRYADGPPLREVRPAPVQVTAAPAPGGGLVVIGGRFR